MQLTKENIIIRNMIGAKLRDVYNPDKTLKIIGNHRKSTNGRGKWLPDVRNSTLWQHILVDDLFSDQIANNFLSCRKFDVFHY